MFYELAHFLQSKFPFLWAIVEWLNSELFSLRFRKQIKDLPQLLESYHFEYSIREATENDIGLLVSFFSIQPEESFVYFKPHGFDAETMKKILRRKSYLSFIVEYDSELIGYFFLRCFFNGKCFRGKIVDFRYRGRGIAKIIGRVSMDIASKIGLRMFGTISRKNQASLHSASAANTIRVIKELPDDYLYIEFLKKECE